MLSTLVALCLMSKQIGRTPTNGERRKVVSVVNRLYTSMRRSQPTSVDAALADLRSENTKIREIVDVNTHANSVTMSQPCSFVTLKDFFTLLRKERCVLAPDHGVYVQFTKSVIHLIDTETTKLLTKKDVKTLFKNSSTTVSFVFFE